tara:strand:- start:371 stop:547 length:177 start_codon:yes stop_codon:yes gene_type:complete
MSNKRKIKRLEGSIGPAFKGKVEDIPGPKGYRLIEVIKGRVSKNGRQKIVRVFEKEEA